MYPATNSAIELPPPSTTSVAITVAVITYKRVAGLQRLLKALTAQEQSSARPFTTTILIVDNDAERSAANTVGQAVLNYPEVDIIYAVEETQGIPFARNKAMAIANLTSDYLAFIDDDELPHERWLDELLAVIYSTSSDCAWGPVLPILPKNFNGILARSGVFDRSRPQAGLKDRQMVPLAATDNVMFALAPIKKLGLEFDERMRFTGGSDLAFFKAAVRAGFKIHWAKKAYVHEFVPPGRVTLNYLLLRQYRTGNTFVASNIFDFTSCFHVKYMIAALGFLVVGILTLVYPIYTTTRAEGIVRIMNGLGIIGGLLGVRAHEYAPSRLE